MTDETAKGPEPTVEELKAKAYQPMEDAMKLHPFYRGKIETTLKCCVRDFQDFGIWYTPGVSAPCLDIQKDPEKVYEYTNKANTVAVISDGTRVLGMGDIGPKAGMPVMEGKSLLFKYLGGVDGFPLMVDTKDPDRFIEFVKLVQPGLGGINLEDIAQPKCFRILDTLREECEIPVWHDDQQGTACVTLAGLINALKVVGRRIDDVEIAFIGSGAANVAISRLIFSYGADPEKCRIVDSKGILHKGRADVEAVKDEWVDKWKYCNITNAEQRTGTIEDALRGAHVCIALSKQGPDTILPEWITRHGPRPRGLPLRQPHPRDVAVGRQGGGRRGGRHRPLRLPQPGEQLGRLPRHLPRHARRARQDDHRRDVHRRGRGARQGAPRTRASPPTTSCRPWTTGRCSRARPRRWR